MYKNERPFPIYKGDKCRSTVRLIPRSWILQDKALPYKTDIPPHVVSYENQGLIWIKAHKMFF